MQEVNDRMKNIWMKIAAILLCLAVCTSWAACKGNAEPEESTPSAESGSSTPEETESETKEPETVAPHTHDFALEWSKNDVRHWHTCTLCDETADGDEHDFELEMIIVEPSGDDKGQALFVCTVCGAAVIDKPDAHETDAE